MRRYLCISCSLFEFWDNAESIDIASVHVSIRRRNEEPEYIYMEIFTSYTRRFVDLINPMINNRISFHHRKLINTLTGVRNYLSVDQMSALE